MDTITWIILAVLVIGIVWYLTSKKKKGAGASEKPEGPAAPPETPAM
jgi:cbb3-type cytochrome oxidase subunit 3